MSMGLTCSGSGTAVEEPETGAVVIDLHQGTPVIKREPVDLRSPVLSDQQHVATLNGVLVENQNVIVVNPLHLEL